MEYLNGIRLTPHLHELSPLDAAIQNFERQAKKYHSKRKAAPGQNETPQQRKQREDDLKKALNHLQQERRLASVMVAVQSKLAMYRNEYNTNNAKSRTEEERFMQAMKDERHHPAYALAMYLRADGRPQPSPIHTAHHIIPGRGKTDYAGMARLNLHMFDIRINDPINGMWLIRRRRDKGHWSMPAANSHSEIHTHNYERWVYFSTLSSGNEQIFRANLLKVRLLLEAGTQPAKVTMPPDNSWDGK